MERECKLRKAKYSANHQPMIRDTQLVLAHWCPTVTAGRVNTYPIRLLKLDWSPSSESLKIEEKNKPCRRRHALDRLAAQSSKVTMENGVMGGEQVEMEQFKALLLRGETGVRSSLVFPQGFSDSMLRYSLGYWDILWYIEIYWQVFCFMLR